MSKEPVKRYDEEEKIFQVCLFKYHDIESCRSTAWVDVNFHIDLYLGNGNSVDVKRQKKINGTDPEPSSIYTWIEYRNGSGRRGWIYGRATHIAFAMGDHYLMVDRRHLVDYAEKVLKGLNLQDKEGKFIITPRKGEYEPYKIYSRNGFDKVMMVEVEDLRKLNHLLVRRDAG